MSLFKRRSESPQQSRDDADAHLSFMTTAAAGRFRAIAAAVFDEFGLPVTVHPDHAIDAAGRQFGFWNIAAQCADAEPDAWPGLVRDHVRRVLESMNAPSPFEGLHRTEAHVRTYARLYEEAFVPPSHRERYPHREFAPGILEMLALDLPEPVAIYNHDNARDLGGYAALRDAGIANLQELAVERVERLAGPRGCAFHALLGESVYTGSRALELPALATRLTGEEPGAFGWLMSVPNRHQVTWHVIKDASVIDVVGAMHHFASLGFSDAPGPVSPHVYWWNGSEYEQLTHHDDDGNPSIRPSPRFQSVLEQLLG